MTLEDIILAKLDKAHINYIHSGEGYIVAQCLNPKHQDRNPSFSINLEEGYGKCFSCGFSINSNYWLEDMTGAEIEKLKDEIYKSTVKKRLYKKELEAKLEDYRELPELPPSTGDIKRTYRGITVETYKELGAYGCKSGKYKDITGAEKYIKNRIIFPMKSLDGRVCAFNSRSIDGAIPKYLYSKGFQPKFNMYPYYTELKKDYIVLVEGIYDAISLYQDGIQTHFNSGLAYNFSQEKLVKFMELGIETIYVMFDEDIRGIEASNEMLKHPSLNKYFEVKHGRELPELKPFYESGYKDYNDYLTHREG